MSHLTGWRTILLTGAQFVTPVFLVTMTVLWEYRWRQLQRLHRERQERETQLVRQAFHDSLTDLPNRALLRDRLDHALVRAQRENYALALLFVDLDQFKTINDQYGHTVGDQVLITTAERLSATLRASDTAARLGGDEFIILVEGLPTSDVAMAIAQRLAASLQAPLRAGSEQIDFTVSIGGVIGPIQEDGAAALMRRADAALHEAKRAGTGRIVITQGTPSAPTLRRVI